MATLKLKVMFAFFPYGGNGGVATEVPALRHWFAKTILACKSDPRIEAIIDKDFSDTPITMTRNEAVCVAREKGADVLVMIDSDQLPDERVGSDPTAKPFFESSFNFLYERYQRGLMTVVLAPYCGPPPIENVYVFRWASHLSNTPNDSFFLEAYSREEAFGRSGFEAIGAGPTGLSMFDMRVFELTDPKKDCERLVEKGLSYPDAASLCRSWFYYEYTDIYQRHKSSTEDVTATRDISLACHTEHQYDCCFVNWDAWAGHEKPMVVRKPSLTTTEQVGEKFRRAIEAKLSRNEKLVMVGEGRASPKAPRVPYRNGKVEKPMEIFSVEQAAELDAFIANDRKPQSRLSIQGSAVEI